MDDPSEYFCPVEGILDVIGGEGEDTDRLVPSERDAQVQRTGAGYLRIIQVMLTRRLGGLERDGIVSRHVRSQALRKVECLPTEYEVTVIPVLASICDWGIHPLGIPMILV